MKFIYKNIKFLIYLFSLVICLTIASNSYAQDSASLVINNLTEGSLNITIRNISNNAIAPGGLITWSDINAGATVWKVANQYIEISHSNLPKFWGFQVYTDNKNTSASPKYTGTANPAGLVKIGNTIFSLPMAWRITDSVIDPNTNANKPVQRSDSTGFTNYMWHFLKDKNTPDNPTTPENEAFINAHDYVVLWNQSGIAWNESGRSGNPKKAYIYLAADFKMASAGSSYKTSLLTMETYKGVSSFPIYLYKDAPLTEYPSEPGATLENHFSPSGWMNYAGQFSIDPKCKEVTPHSGTHCFKLSWNGANGADGGKWGGVMWLEPANIWDYSGNSPTHKGYDLRGANYLSFWARTNTAGAGTLLTASFGNIWDTSGQTPAIPRTPALNTTWQQYLIPVADRDMSNITGGLAIVFDAEYTPSPSGCVIYLDDIKFDRY